MKRTEILKDTLSCRIHPHLKDELSTEAYANGQTTSAYVENLLFNRHQIIDDNAKDYYEKFYLAQEELEKLNQLHDEEIEKLKQKLSEANQKVEKHDSLVAQLQEWKDYASSLKGQNEEMSNNLHEITNKLQNLENENAQISQQLENAKISEDEDEAPQEESTSGTWKLLLGIFIAVVLSVIGYLVFRKKAPTPVATQVQNNNIPPIGHPYIQ